MQEIIPKLPADIKAAVLIVQHMPKNFTRLLADRLDSISQLKVSEAVDGEKIKSGNCYIAPGDSHLRVAVKADSCYINLGQDATVSGHRPSVDALFKSLYDQQIAGVIAIILTGMGSDGARELKRLKQLGAKTIGQDKASCTVYGMPKVAKELGAVQKESTLSALADEIMNALEE